MLGDLMEFAAMILVDNGRLSFWMPTANDEDFVLEIPSHPCLELVSVCVQTFNKCMNSWSVLRLRILGWRIYQGSRRLLTYRRVSDSSVREIISSRKSAVLKGTTANDLNSFRKRVRVDVISERKPRC